MNQEDFDKVIRETLAHTADLLVRKGDEYAAHADRLMNFKRNAVKQATTPLQIWKQYVGKHIDSIDSYFQRVNKSAIIFALDEVAKHNRTAHESIDAEMFLKALNQRQADAIGAVDSQLSEPIEGRFYDIINYCFLGLALLKEERKSKPPA